MNAIEIKGLSKTFRGKKRTLVQALQDVTFDIPGGGVFGFLGPNGAGKSTTIKVLTGQLRPTTGAVRIFGEPAGSPAACRKIGYLPENPSFYDFLSAREYLGFVGRSFNMDKTTIATASEKVLGTLDLLDNADRPIRGFSKGMVQRLGLAQALLHDPEIYILDEPMSGLDPLGRALVKDVIRDLKRRGKTVFFSTHITADIEAVCDRIGIIVRGRLRSLEKVDALLRKGVEGYWVRYIDPTGCEQKDMIAHDRLREQLDMLLASGATLDGIEPCRRDMEAYFLQTVREAESC